MSDTVEMGNLGGRATRMNRSIQLASAGNLVPSAHQGSLTDHGAQTNFSHSTPQLQPTTPCRASLAVWTVEHQVRPITAAEYAWPTPTRCPRCRRPTRLPSSLTSRRNCRNRASNLHSRNKRPTPRPSVAEKPQRQPPSTRTLSRVLRTTRRMMGSTDHAMRRRDSALEARRGQRSAAGPRSAEVRARGTLASPQARP